MTTPIVIYTMHTRNDKRLRNQRELATVRKSLAEERMRDHPFHLILNFGDWHFLNVRFPQQNIYGHRNGPSANPPDIAEFSLDQGTILCCDAETQAKAKADRLSKFSFTCANHRGLKHVRLHSGKVKGAFPE